MMSNTYTMTNAALLLLTAGWFTIGVIITAMVATHITDRAKSRAYNDGWENAHNFHTRNVRKPTGPTAR
jgi:hypothetical protein